LDGFGRVAVLGAHEPVGFVGADGEESGVGRAEVFADLVENAGVVSGVAAEVEAVACVGEVESGPEAGAAASGEPVAPVLGGGGGEGESGEEGGLTPPVELKGACESGALEEEGVTGCGDAEGGVVAGEVA
jgi:hypothetical protein